MVAPTSIDAWITKYWSIFRNAISQHAQLFRQQQLRPSTTTMSALLRERVRKPSWVLDLSVALVWSTNTPTQFPKKACKSRGSSTPFTQWCLRRMVRVYRCWISQVRPEYHATNGLAGLRSCKGRFLRIWRTMWKRTVFKDSSNITSS